MAQLSYPGFQLTFYLQNNQPPLIIREAMYTGNPSDFDGEIYNISTNNDMSNDNPVFTLILNSNGHQWNMILAENDIVSIQICHDYYDQKSTYDTVMVGMISSIEKREDYSNGNMQFVITGMAMSKVLSNVTIGALQGYLPVTNWLPDDPNKGIQFTGSTSGQIMTAILAKFVYDNTHISYTYNVNGISAPLTYFIHDNIQNNVDENLVGSEPYTNYSGTLTQFMKSLSAAPFNEIFWTFPDSTTCVFNYRPTQFDEALWTQLPRVTIDNDAIYQVDIAKNDTEQYAIFKVNIPSNITGSSGNTVTPNNGIYPITNLDLIHKYGYNALQVDNPYIFSNDAASMTGNNNGNKVNETSGVSLGQTNNTTPNPPDYLVLLAYMSGPLQSDAKLKDDDGMRKNQIAAVNQLYAHFAGALGYAQCQAIVKQYLNGKATPAIGGYLEYVDYQDILKTVKYDTSAVTTNTQDSLSGPTKLQLYTEKLFNWYADDSKFYSGNIIILGKPDLQVGQILMWYDLEAQCIWEAYIEAVNHDYDFQMGYLTTIGITRGIPIPQDYTGDPTHYRFTFYWGQYIPFAGGYFGEPTLSEETKIAEDFYGTDPNGVFTQSPDGSTGAMKALSIAKSHLNQGTYTWGGGRSGSDPLKSNNPKVDCSSFVWWCYHEAGIDLNGGSKGMTTYTIAADPTLTTVSANHSNKNDAMSKLSVGDIVFFNTEGTTDGHVGIYSGNTNFIAANGSDGTHPTIQERNMISDKNDGTYWWNAFGGHVMRY